MDCFCIHTSFSLKVDKRGHTNTEKGGKLLKKEFSSLHISLKTNKLTHEECQSECVFTRISHISKFATDFFNTSYRCFSKLKMAL